MKTIDRAQIDLGNSRFSDQVQSCDLCERLGLDIRCGTPTGRVGRRVEDTQTGLGVDRNVTAENCVNRARIFASHGARTPEITASVRKLRLEVFRATH